MKKDDNIKILNVGLIITQDLANSRIHLQSPLTQRSYTVTQQELTQFREIHYQFKLEDDHITESLYFALYELSKFLTNAISISVYAATTDPNYQKQNFQSYFQSLFFALFSHAQNLQHIHIETSKTFVGDLVPTFILERVLPQAKNLKSLSFIIPHCGIRDFSIQSLINADLTNLEKFRLNIAGAIFLEKDLIQFLSKIPNVKDLLIGLGDTPTTQNTFELFSTDTLPSLNKLERLEVGVWNTQISDEAVHKLLINLPMNIKSLVVVLDGTNTTDASLLEFLESKISLLSNLQQLFLSASMTLISNEISEKVDQINQRISSRN